jgi:hypothetical protein
VEAAQRDRCRQAALLGRECEHCDELVRKNDAECMRLVTDHIGAIVRKQGIDLFHEWLQYCRKYGVSACVITYDSMDALRQGSSSGYRMQSAKIVTRNFPNVEQLQAVLENASYPFERFMIVTVPVKIAEYATFVGVMEIEVNKVMPARGKSSQ